MMRGARLGSWDHCGKLKMLIQLLDLWRKAEETVHIEVDLQSGATIATQKNLRNKVLIFSRSTRLLDIVEFTLRTHCGIRLLRLDGST